MYEERREENGKDPHCHWKVNFVKMMGKRMHHSSKTRVASKAATSLEGGKPSSPAAHAHGKPARLPGAASQGKLRPDVCPVAANIPFTRLADTATVLPRYAAVAARSIDEPIGMDELDGLQSELEAILCDAALRVRRFQAEIDSIDMIESKREKRGKAADKRLQYPVKRKFQEDRPMKPKDHTRMSNPKMPKYKSFPNTPSTASHSTFSNDNLMTSDNSVKLEMSQLALPKNNIPYKFWSSVEPYAAPVTHEDVKFLETLLATSSNTSLPPIPPLGRHYSEVWADEHTSEDQSSGKKSSGVSPDSARKKTEKLSENMITGPLTQRLVSALMEENAMPYEVPDVKVKPGGTLTNKSTYRNSLTLEKCLRKELIEQGILEPDDLPPLTSPADDEILAEIKKTQAELMVVRKENCRNLRHLIGLSKQELIRTNLRKQLEQIDAECLDIFKKINAAKQKKRPITKKERDDAWRTINEQIRLQKEINALPPTGPNVI